jgi:hypothetical protein
MTDFWGQFAKTHPFINEPGEWLTIGMGMQGADLSRFPLDGRTNVYHEEGRIRVEGFLSVIEREEKSFTTCYHLLPTDHENLLEYRQESRQLGDLRGEMVCMDDRLVTSFASGDGALQGCEVLHRLGENRYTLTGFVSREGSFVSLWKVDLVRKAAGA